MSNTQEARDRHRQTLALEALVTHVKAMAEAIDKLNRNFAGWVRDGEERFEQFAAELKAAEDEKKEGE